MDKETPGQKDQAQTDRIPQATAHIPLGKVQRPCHGQIERIMANRILIALNGCILTVKDAPPETDATEYISRNPNESRVN